MAAAVAAAVPSMMATVAPKSSVSGRSRWRSTTIFGSTSRSASTNVLARRLPSAVEASGKVPGVQRRRICAERELAFSTPRMAKTLTLATRRDIRRGASRPLEVADIFARLGSVTSIRKASRVRRKTRPFIPDGRPCRFQPQRDRLRREPPCRWRRGQTCRSRTAMCYVGRWSATRRSLTVKGRAHHGWERQSVEGGTSDRVRTFCGQADQERRSRVTVRYR